MEARSTENVFNLAFAGSTGLAFGIAGSVGLALADSDTVAWIDELALVNPDPAGAHADQSISVVAANDCKTYGLSVNLVAGAITIGAGVDLGVIDNDTQALVKRGAVLRARQDIEVHALSRAKGPTRYSPCSGTNGMKHGDGREDDDGKGSGRYGRWLWGWG